MVLFALASCSDFLEEENKTDVLADDLYKTESGYESLVNASYSTLRGIYDAPWMFTAGTDMYINGRDQGPTGLMLYTELAPSDPTVEGFYKTMYGAIQLCNTGIQYNSLTEQTSTTPVRLGELKFLRAYYYFMLVQTFGGVSLVSDAISEPATSFERNSAEEVYDFIIAEMNEALNLVSEQGDTSFGRVSKRAVRHYLAKIHLTRGYESFAASDDFDKAADFADDAINGYDLSTLSFANVFKPGNEDNAEVLFSVQYSPSSLSGTSGGSSQSAYFGPYHGGSEVFGDYPYRHYSLVATKYVYDLFSEDDARWEGTFMNVVYDRYYDYYDVADKSSLDIRYYYPHAWEVADTVAWRAADPAHRAGTIILPYQNVGNTNRWETPEKSTDNQIPAVRKFDDPVGTGVHGDGNSTRDIILARLAETYLIAAEAYLQSGDKATALDRLNAVKERAEKTAGTLVLTNADDVDLEEILDERARELVGEYHRWFDLKRTGTLKDRTMTFNKEIRSQTNPFQGVDGADKILRPIPQQALNLNANKDFPQNPGYN